MSSRMRPGSSSSLSEGSYYESIERAGSPNPALYIHGQKHYLPVGSPTGPTVTRLVRHGGGQQTLERVQDHQQQYQHGNEVTYVQNSPGQVGLSSPTEVQNRQHQYILSQSMKGINIPTESEVIVHKTFVTVNQVPSAQVYEGVQGFQSYQNIGNSQTHWEDIKYSESQIRNDRSPVQVVSYPNEHITSRSTRSSVTSQEYDLHSEETQMKCSGGGSPVPARTRSPHPSQIKSAMDYESGNTEKLDPRYFGELLAELKCKTTELHNILQENTQKIKCKQGSLQMNLDLNGTNENLEALIPKGVSELTKQHLRYILQTRFTVDKSLRLLLETFSSLREDLLHLQDDLRSLATDKEMLEKDLGFKSQKMTEYSQLLESVRENNRQLQSTIKENGSSHRSLEDLMLTLRNSEADKEFRVKELEFSKRALEQDNESLRQQLMKSPSTATFTTDISNNYYEMVSKLREEKDKEITVLRSQISNMKREMSSGQDSSSSMEIKLMQYNNNLSEKDSIIQQKNEEITRLRSSQHGSNNVTRTIITKRYLDYPILGLLDNIPKSPSKERKTIFYENNRRK
ncbi:protein POF1B [Amblyraja radiata]|uniref:protein POF1B n=1 Tax=Amblyraja radiata TaxID=386614 RepID=UPI0014026123|nr:protein POF1B [Amblyraja radiata]XP_032886304.1 protein POF1B [Amblyraja radiata]